MAFSADQWAVILGGSSGFGLATAKRLGALGMSVCVVHRDRRAMLAKIEPEFEKIRAGGTRLLTINTDARVFGLTSEGNEVAWKGYAAVAAAKVSLESLARSIAVEFAPYGIRCNVIQAGITHTPAQDAIPGSAHMRAQALSRNPMGRLTTPADVANVIGLLACDEAGWINGEVIRVDGGEHISRASS